MGRYVVEVIPHLSGFSEIKNIVDKVDCNRYVLFRTANISPLTSKIEKEESQFWQTAFQKEQVPLQEEETKITFPYTRKESHHEESNQVLLHHLLEILQDKGGKALAEAPLNSTIPLEPPETVKSATATKCFFCDGAIAEYQTVYTHEDVSVFYNVRKGVKPGTNFLILPNRHTEKVYRVTPSEIDHMGLLRKALVEVLKETHPKWEVVIYTQDDPSVGQTVFHSHEQVVAIDPQTIALTWTVASLLYPAGGNVSKEEMEEVKKEFGLKIGDKLRELAEPGKAAAS